MKRTKKEINEAFNLLHAIDLIISMQKNSRIFNNGLDTLYAAVQEIEEIKEITKEETI